MKHLILGSSGQIGKALCKYLKSINEEVIEFDIKKNRRYDLRMWDDFIFRESVEESDFVHFLAFDVGGAVYLNKNQNKHDFISNNMRIMTNVFNILQITKKPFIFASSPNYPTNSYGMLKRLGEKMTLDLNGVVTRFWNVYDMEDNNERAHVITDFIKMGREKQLIKMRTDGYESRQFLYGEDCAECLYKITQKYEELKGSSLDVTSFKWYTIKQVANIVSELFGGIPIIPGTEMDTQNDAKLEPHKDILKLWQPKTELKTGIKILIDEA